MAVPFHSHPNRLLALAAKEKFFDPAGQKCANSHSSPRYTLSGECCQCAREKYQRKAALRPPRPKKPPAVSRLKTVSPFVAAQRRARCEAQCQRTRETFGRTLPRKAAAGLYHSMSTPEAAIRGRYLNDLIKQGKNLIR